MFKSFAKEKKLAHKREKNYRRAGVVIQVRLKIVKG